MKDTKVITGKVRLICKRCDRDTRSNFYFDDGKPFRICQSCNHRIRITLDTKQSKSMPYPTAEETLTSPLPYTYSKFCEAVV